MQIERRFTSEGRDPYDGVPFRKASSEIRNPDGSVVFGLDAIEAPANWSQVAVDVLAQKYFRKAGVPARLKKVEENDVPSFLWRSVADEAALAALPDQVDAVAQAFYEPARALGERLARADLVLLAGAGPHYAPAAFGAAKLKELAPIHAVAFPLEEYHHYRTQKAGDPMFLIAPDAVSHARALETAIMSRGCEGFCIALVPEGETAIAEVADVVWALPPVAAETAPIVYSVPLHLFGYHVAMARDAIGLGAPRLGV